MPLEILDQPYEPYTQVAVRAGAGTAVVGIDQTIERDGSGPYFEVEVGRRMSPAVSLAVFAAYFTSSDAGGEGDFGYTTDYSRDRYVDVAARASYHPFDEEHGPFFGGGVGYEGLRASGVDACMSPDTPPCVDASGKSSVSFHEPFNKWSHGLLVEVHAGITLPKLEVASIQFVVMLTHSTADGAPYTARAVAGVAF